MTASAIEELWGSARRLRRKHRAAKSLPALLFFTDRDRTPDVERVLAALPRGAGVVFRAFGAPDAAAWGGTLARLARRRGLVFMVGADVRLAVALRADGLHLPERLVGRVGAVRALRRRFLVTAAVHGLAAAIRARRSGVDAVVISPVFASRSPSSGKPIGILAFASLVRGAGTPAYALGGIGPKTALRLAGSGAVGLAAVEALAGGEAAIRT